ncbi:MULTISPECIES: hypothetical protein [unclassified Beijerinckia]|uniref:hypothetical protein n=1 Tax=unclassified Beijerinckia TaxID=2638183 RepID=UPI000894AC59|nr:MULTISPECIES: hypothetical protein [unclassified Beijerinckia]MDH7798438.1 hypothetical protein [Beijerinckia sp. GAS462]SED20890.1 hypothetical protein SAMN05443249_4736 [Beijerinckia sp. 28-YEA-48]
MTRIRTGSPSGTIRPFVPNLGVANDVEGQKADALDHIAKALSAIDHNFEVLINIAKEQNKLLAQIASTLPSKRH